LIAAVRSRAVSLAVLLVASCASHSTPRSAVGDYLTAEQQGRYADAHALLSSTDRAARPLDAYVAEHVNAGPIWLAVAKRTQFTVGSLRQDGDSMFVSVKARHPDPKVVEAAVPGIPVDVLSTSPDPVARVTASVENTLEASRFPTVEETLTFGAREEDGEWRVWLGLDRQDQVIHLLAQARAAVAKGDAEAARKAWTEALDVEGDAAGVVASLQEEAKKGLATP
jgi:hypothetical protein